MQLPFRRRDPTPQPRLPHARPMTPPPPPPFTCSTCGRSDLPEAGDWDPPVCEECDAAINFDLELEVLDD